MLKLNFIVALRAIDLKNASDYHLRLTSISECFLEIQSPVRGLGSSQYLRAYSMHVFGDPRMLFRESICVWGAFYPLVYVPSELVFNPYAGGVYYAHRPLSPSGTRIDDLGKAR